MRRQLDEAELIEKLEKMCNPDAADGEWITQLDLVEEGSKLEVKDMGKVGVVWGA